jgi:diacylglycerol O-acyltransferase
VASVGRTEEELQELAGSLFSTVMNRQRPLWDLTLVDGLRGRRSAVIARVHHCLVDGVAGVGLMNILMDASPEIPKLPKKKPFKAPPLPDPLTALMDALLSTAADMADRFIYIQEAAMKFTLAAIAGGMGTPEQALGMLPELLRPVERLPFNQPCKAARKVTWTKFPMAEINAIRDNSAATVNDVALTLITGTIRRYAEFHGASLQHRMLRIFVPVNLRGCNDKQEALGNRISIMPVSIPLDIDDPKKLLEAVHERTQALKSFHIADLVYLAGMWLGMTPVPLQVMSGPLSVFVTEPVFNMVCTNVPGPKSPLYLLGHKMLTYYPYVPIGNDWGIGCAFQSYDQSFFANFTADSVAAPDPERLCVFMQNTFADLLKSAGVQPAAQKLPRRRAASGPKMGSKRPRPTAAKQPVSPLVPPPAAVPEPPGSPAEPILPIPEPQIPLPVAAPRHQ